MLHKYLRLFVTLVLICFKYVSFASTGVLFTSNHDLPNSLINKIVETRDGMIWIATENGLCRYNGSSFVTYYHHSNDEHSLASNFIRTIEADGKGHLMVGTTDGLQMYRPETNDFTSVISINSKEKHCNVSDIAYYNGVFYVSGNQNFSVRVDGDGNPKAEKNRYTSTKYIANQTVVDSNGNIWLVCHFRGVYCVDKKGNIRTIKDEHGQPYLFYNLYQGPDGRMYASSNHGGLYVKNSGSDIFTLVPGSESFPIIRDMKVLPGTNIICLATDGLGIRFYDCRKGQMVSQIIDDPFIDLSSQKVHSLCFTNDGDVWMAFFQRGVYLSVAGNIGFNYVGNRSKRFDFIGDRCVTSVLETHDGGIWVSTDNGGIYGVSRDGTSLGVYHSGNGAGQVPSSPLALFEDSRQRVWFGSYGSGYGQIDLRSGRCKYLSINGAGVAGTSVYGFAEDGNSNIWGVSMGSGLLFFDESKQQFTVYSATRYVKWACAIYYDNRNNNLYVGTYDGLLSLDMEGINAKGNAGSAKRELKLLLRDYVVHSISPRGKEQLCVSTNNGLILYNTRTGNVVKYGMAEGLPSMTIYSALEADDGSLWVSSTKGLSHIFLKAKEVENFSVRDGLQGNEFYKNAVLRGSDGAFFFGGMNGMTWFYPKDVQMGVQNCHVKVAEVKSDMKSFLADEDGNFHIEDGIQSFSIDLVTSPISMTYRAVYCYQMDGDGWQKLPSSVNSISYSHLSPGNHEFEVYAIINGKQSEVARVHLYIAYPWYRQWWAWVLWISLATAMSCGGYVMRQRRNAELKIMAESKQAEQIKEEKLQFFINIAHDLRTPMTLIVSPLQKLMALDKDESRRHSYEIMYRNANRILNLVNQLMDARRIDRGKMPVNCREVDFTALFENIVDSVTDLAERRNQSLTTEKGVCTVEKAWLDTDFLEKILINLIGNSVKYTEEGGYVKVKWFTLEAGATVAQGTVDAAKFAEGALALQVIDNGIGIPEEEQKYVFDRFYQIPKNRKHEIGTGIGLNLVHSLVQLHHGDITISNNPEGRGTIFTILMPLGSKAYSAEEMIKDEIPANVVYTDKALLKEKGEMMSVAPVVEMPEGHLPSRQTILVVDDEEEIRNYLAEELSDTYNVKMCNDGEEAMSLLLREHVDIVLSDVMMPKVDGLELCRRIRENVLLNHLPIILLTAKNTDTVRLDSLKLSVETFISKPFNMAILRSTVDSLLRRQSSLRNTFSGKQMPTDQIATPDVQSPDDRLMERIVKVINDNLSNPDITSEDIAREVGLSRVHLYRKLTELTNQTASNYIRNIRLAKGAELLQNKKMSVSEIAYQVGFKTPNHFATAFKKMYGVSPTDYMKQFTDEK